MYPDLKINNGIVETNTVLAGIDSLDERDPVSFYKQISERSYLDTGILPLNGDGLLSLRKAGDRTQFVFQHSPGIYRIIWGEREGDDDADVLDLAQPYRIIIGDLVNGEMRGIRHFYSPVPITSENQILYHVNLPNTNCRGYEGTTVGWICLYHGEGYGDMTLTQRMHRMIERASGSEAYNERNMAETDGPNFYKEHYTVGGPDGAVDMDYSYLWDKYAWYMKTEEDGYDWTLNPDLWIPIRVNSIDHQFGHIEHGQIFTLEMAMYGNYRSYYPESCPDEDEQTLMNRLARTDLQDVSSFNVYHPIRAAFYASAKKGTVKKPAAKEVVKVSGIPGITGTLLAMKETKLVWQPASGMAPLDPSSSGGSGICPNCNTDMKDSVSVATSDGARICETCFDAYYVRVDCCSRILHGSEAFAWDEELYCRNCHSFYMCLGCSATFLDTPQSLLMLLDVCVECHPACICVRCGMDVEDKVQYQVPVYETPDSPARVDIVCETCYHAAPDTIVELPDLS